MRIILSWKLNAYQLRFSKIFSKHFLFSIHNWLIEFITSHFKVYHEDINMLKSTYLPSIHTLNDTPQNQLSMNASIYLTVQTSVLDLSFLDGNELLNSLCTLYT